MSKLNRRDFLKSISIAAASTLMPGCTEQLHKTSAKAAEKPNVIFIFDDELRADACSVYGGKNIQTPNIDKLASQGIRFTNALSTCPLCTPFRGMLQTGRYPTHSGLVCNWVEVNPNQTSIANIFNSAGYRTAFIGKWHLAAGMRKHQGLYEPSEKGLQEYKKKNPETEFVPPGRARLGYQHWEAFNFHMNFNNWWFYRDQPRKIFVNEYETDGEFRLAMEFIQKQKDLSQPFFLMVAPHPPHPPYDPSYCLAGYLDKIPQNLHFSPNVPSNHPHRKKPLALRCYYAMVKNFDDNVGRLMKFLDDSGLSENTIVVLTSDHGDQHGSHNKANKMVPYAESVNIPLIIRWPKHIPAGITSDELYTPIDHMTTLAGLVSITPPATADGIDLSKVVLGKSKSNRDAVLMANYTSDWDYFQTGTTWPEWRGVHTKQYTYAKWLNKNKEGEKEQLFDNIADPYQINNLAANPKYASVMKKMRKKLKELLAQAHDDFLPGTAYADWYDKERNLICTALGPVK